MIINHKTSDIRYITGSHVIDTGLSYNYLQYPSVPDTSTGICSNRFDSERELVSMLTMEAWNSFGVKIIFYKTTYNVKRDKVWGEDGNRCVTDAWDVMSYFQLPKENKVWGKFGIEGINDVSMFISKEHFRSETDDYIPQVGDLVLSVYNNKLYEITEVKEEAPLFMLSKQYAWELIVRKAKIENEISISPSLSASPISNFYNVDDIFDVRTDVDIEKEDIKYKPIAGEKPIDNPFGKW